MVARNIAISACHRRRRTRPGEVPLGENACRRKNAIQLRSTDPAAIELARKIGPQLDNAAALAAALAKRALSPCTTTR
jgi:hypothetical protein